MVERRLDGEKSELRVTLDGASMDPLHCRIWQHIYQKLFYCSHFFGIILFKLYVLNTVTQTGTIVTYHISCWYNYFSPIAQCCMNWASLHICTDLDYDEHVVL